MSTKWIDIVILNPMNTQGGEDNAEVGPHNFFTLGDVIMPFISS